MKFSKTKVKAFACFILAIASYAIIYFNADLINSPELSEIVRFAYKSMPFFLVFIGILLFLGEIADKQLDENIKQKRLKDQK